MKIVKILCGAAVLVTALSFARILQNNVRQHMEFLQRLDALHASHAAARTPAFFVGLGTGAIILVLSAIGGGLLIARR